MFIVDVTQPLTLVLLLAATVLLIFLGREVKKPQAPAVALILFLGLIIVHSVQFSLASGPSFEQYRSTLLGCLTIDLIMIFVTFFGYLWIDDLSCKFYKKKSLDDSLEWLWKQV